MALSRWLSSWKKENGYSQTIVNKMKTDPYYRFQSVEEIEIAGQLGIKIDVNLATVDDWLRLPGISITQARNLVEIVNSGIHLLCIEDLAGALGISVLTIQVWQPVLYFAYYASDSFISPRKVNINEGTIAQLMTIPNIEKAIVEKIIAEKEKNGKYRHIADLQKRVNLSQEMSYHLMGYLQF
jgi:DNA uptake protein ComE-like DNA-binding protein